LGDLAFLGHLAIVFCEPSIKRLKDRLTYWDYNFWRHVYAKEFGLECNGFKFQWEKQLSEPEKAAALIAALGGEISPKELEELKRCEYGEKERLNWDGGADLRKD